MASSEGISLIATLAIARAPGDRSASHTLEGALSSWRNYHLSALRKPLLHVLREKKLPHITVHGLRRTMNNLVRKQAPGIVTRSIMGHVSEVMTNHYSIADSAEKKAAVAAVVQLIRGSSGGPSAEAPKEEVRKAE